MGSTVRYEFILAERLADIAQWAFPELRESTVPVGARGSVLYGEIVDTAHLRGIIDRLQDLGYTILEMRCLPD